MRLPVATTRQALESVHRLAEQHDLRPLPFVLVRRENEPVSIPLPFRAGSPARKGRGIETGSFSRRTRTKGKGRRSCCSARRCTDSRAWRVVATGRRMAASRARWLSRLTVRPGPSTLHHSGAMPAARARAAMASGVAAREGRVGAATWPRTITDLGSTETASSRIGPSRLESELSARIVQAWPSSGSGRRTMIGAGARWTTTTVRSTLGPSGAARLMTRVWPAGSSHWPGSRPAPSARRQSTSGSMPVGAASPVRKRSARKAGCRRLISASLAVKSIRPWSAPAQSSQPMALSWA